MAFVLQDVIKELEGSCSLELLKKLQKGKPCSSHCPFGITPAAGATKSHFIVLIKEYCINNIIDEVEEKPTAEVLEFAHEAQRAREAVEAEAPKVLEKLYNLRKHKKLEI